MATKYLNDNISLTKQLCDLKHKFQSIKYSIRTNELVWVQSVKLTEYSKNYEICLIYNGISPKVYLINQGIIRSKGEYIPHCYERNFKDINNEYVQICLYYPKYSEWSREMYLSETIIPWTMDWLKYYELWRITGEWLGGGINHEKNSIHK